MRKLPYFGQNVTVRVQARSLKRPVSVVSTVVSSTSHPLGSRCNMSSLDSGVRTMIRIEAPTTSSEIAFFFKGQRIVI